jgi:hypothetical protein
MFRDLVERSCYGISFKEFVPEIFYSDFAHRDLDRDFV